MIYPNTFEHKLGFDRIREMLSALCMCPLGVAKVDEMTFCTDYEEVNVRLDRVEEFREICLMETDFPLDYFIDVTRYLKKIRIEGTYLDPQELFDLKRSLDTLRAIINFFNRESSEKYINLRALAAEVKMFPMVSDRIATILTAQGRIKDNASPLLGEIRRKLSQKQGEVSKRMTQILKKAQSEGWVDSDASVSVHDGVLVIPVPAISKRRLRGMILGESATGKTAFVEPEEALEINSEIRALENDERREIIRILIEISNVIRPYLSELMEGYNFMGHIDFIRAKANLAITLDAVRPVVQNKPYINWLNAVHPLLFIRFQKEGKTVVPLSLTLNEEDRILLISGPNAGGKSVCMQTVALLQYMLQSGCLIPVKATSEAGIFDNLFIDIGDDQSLETDLSTYSSHLENMKFFLRNANASTLLFIDEMGSGTEPTMGGAIAESIMARLNEKLAFGIITTHFTNLKLFASETEGFVNGAMLFDNHTMSPLYKLNIGQPGSSFAFEIARKIGLPEDVLRNASDKLGEDHMNFDKHLRDLVRDKRYWEEKRRQVKDKEKQLGETLDRYKVELQTINEQRKTIIAQAKREATDLLSTVNKRIENTIFEIKDVQAEKEKTREIRKDFEEFKKTALEQTSEEEQRIQRKMEQILQREERKKQNKEKEAAAGGKPQVVVPTKIKADEPLAAGDKIRMKGQSIAGTVLSVNGKQVTATFGNLTTSLSIDKIERISQTDFKKALKEEKNNSVSRSVSSSYNMGERKLNFRAQLDVRGKRADEAIALVTEFIDEAIMVDASEVKILHGKGNGILRELIRQLLATIPAVEHFADESVQFGGAGITVVHF
jgi:DNA mismatch repair protein MutS2